MTVQLIFQIRQVALRDNRTDDKGFERRKTAYLAFVEKQAGGPSRFLLGQGKTVQKSA